MKIILDTLAILLFTIISSFGQIKKVPKNLKQAIAFLNSDCPDSLKTIIKITDDKDIKRLSYPWDGEYKTIFEWTSDENDNSAIVKYLKSRGISSHQTEVILIAFKRFLLGKQFDEDLVYQPFQEIEKKWTAEDKIKFTTDSLRGIYIPQNLEDCFNQINSFWDDSIKLKVKNLTEDDFSSKVHLGFGMWMRNNWQLWGGSRLSKFFNDKGIYNPEDMSGIILDSYHRYLNSKAIKLDEQIQYYKDYWEKSKKQELERKQKEFAEYEIGDTIIYKYELGYSTKEQEEKFDKDICLAKGKIIERNEEKLFIKILLLESCGKKGIIYYDNKNYKIYNPKTKTWEKPDKRVIKFMKNKEEKWFNYNDWEPNN